MIGIYLGKPGRKQAQWTKDNYMLKAKITYANGNIFDNKCYYAWLE